MLPPLFHRHHVRAKDNDPLLDGARCSNANQSLSSSAWQHNDPGACATIAEHLTKALDLVASNLCGRLELEIKVWTLGVVSVLLEIILLNQRQVPLVARLFDSSHLVRMDLEYQLFPTAAPLTALDLGQLYLFVLHLYILLLNIEERLELLLKRLVALFKECDFVSACG